MNQNDAVFESIREHVLPQFELQGADVRPFGSGLINRTYQVWRGAERFVLQCVNPIFPPNIHRNILAVTERLSRAGLITPRLIPTRDGSPCAELGDKGVWRLMTYVDGVSFDVIDTLEQVRSAGSLVGRFHAALQTLASEMVPLRAGVHDTPRHMARLEQAIDELRHHRLHSAVAVLADDIFARAAELAALPALETQVCHGDLKFNNFLFCGPNGRDSDRALCLIDLDTVGPMSLAYELGDAWRSWCNRAGENSTEARLDLDVFRSSLLGYREGVGRALTANEKAALLGGPEWISLELAARFAADALYESYFGWNRQRFPRAGEHNLLRARGQWSLHKAFVDTRALREKILGEEFGQG